MSWTSAELAVLDGADEVEVSSYRDDGTLRTFVTTWAVSAGGAVYVRSAYGGGGWFQRAGESGSGRLRFAGIERDVTFTQAAPDEQLAIDEAYRAKYGRYANIAERMIGPSIYPLTLRLDTRE
jgi:hypothetical protein